MASQDQIEIINSHGEIRFHTLNGSGITNIGRHPDNDIVIESPVVAPFHAVLDHQQKPFRLVALNNSAGPIKVSGQILQPNAPHILHNWDTIELDGHSLVLMESGAASGAPAPIIAAAPLPIPIPAIDPVGMPVEPIIAAGSPSGDIPSDFPDLDELDRLLATLPEDRSDDIIIVNPIAQNGAIDPNHPSALDFQVDVEQSATMQINVTNGGDLVGEFMCEVRGLDPTWVAIAPPSVNLLDGGEGSFSIAITAPRLASSRAKAYYFSIVVTSPNYPGRMNSIGALLVLKPFYNYAVGDIDPRKQNISWTKRMGKAIIPVQNLGNSPATFQVSGDDERHAATIEFDSPEQGLKLVGQMQASIPPEQTLAVPIFVTPKKRRFVGFGGEDISYTVTITPLTGEQTTPRSVLAQARNLPFIGPIPIILLVILLLLGVVLLLTPRIDEFTVDKTVTSTGDTFTLSWKTSPFTSLHIDPAVGKVDGPSGSKTLTAADPDMTYTLVAETWLTPLYPPWFTAKKDVTLTINPVLPVIRTFATTAKTANVGDSVTISWAVDKTDRLVLTIDGAPETIPPEQMTGSRTFVMEKNTTFNLQAFNADAPNGISQSLVVEAVVPTPTAYPPPTIKSFLVEPQTITVGDEVTLTWEVTGVDKIKISGVENELPAKGSLTVRPATNASYVLEAVTLDGQKATSAVYNVTVNTPPTPTPIPGPPVIEFFKITPAEVALGTPESKNVQLSWKVTGGITNIQISDPSGKSSGLSSEGTQTVSVDKTTIFVLTAFNGPLTTSQTVQIKVKNPVPKITALNPNASTDVGGGSFVLTVTGSGFVKDSKVQWAGSNRSTVYVSGTQLTATILPEDLTAAGLFDVKVVNATPGGGSSGTVQFTLNNPVPTITSITPGTVTKGLTSLTLYVNGTNFVAGPNGQNGSKINFNGADLATVYISNTQLSAQLTTGQLGTPGTFAVKVTNPTPGGGTATSSASFVINPSNLKPTISSFGPVLSPLTQLYVGSQDLTLQVNGTLFVPGSLIKWKGIILPPPTGQTVYQSDTKMVVVVSADKLASVGTVSVRAFNPAPGGGDSDPQTLSIVALPIHFSLTSSTVQINSAVIATVTVDAVQANAVTLSLSAVPGGYVAFYPKVDVDCTSLTAGPITIPAGSSSTQFCVKGIADSSSFSGGITITAALPASLGGLSDSDTLTVISNPPTISSLTPVSASYAGCPAPGTGVGNSALQLSINGQYFVSQSRVSVSTSGGAPGTFTTINTPPTINGTGTNLVVGIPSTFVGSPTTIYVRVSTGTFSSGSLPFNVNAPTLSSTMSCPVSGAGLSPNTAVAGAADLTLTVKGENFVQGSTIYWNGASFTTSFVDHNQLQTTITASDLDSTGTFPVLVKNPNLGATQTTALNFSVTAPTLTLTPSSTSLQVGTSQAMTVSLGSSQSVPRTVLLSLDSGHTGVATITDCSGNTITSVVLTASASPSTGFCVVGAANSATSATLTAVVQGMSGSTDTTSVSVTLAPVTVALSVTSPTVSGTEPYTGQDVTLHAAVTAVNPLAGVPTGTVTFKDGLVTLTCNSGNPVTLSGGTADCVTSFNSNNLAAHSLTAVYTASGNFSSNTSSPVSLTVQKAPTSVTLATVSDITYGESVTFQVALLAVGGGTPTGTVTMYNDLTAIPGATGNVATASSPGLTPSSLLNAAGYQLNAHYNGDNNYASSISSPNQSFTVAKANTSNTLSASPSSPTFYGQAITFTATIVNTSSTGVPPTGTINFKDGGTTITGCGSKTLSGTGNTATATCTTSATGLNVASHTITATYDNTDGNFDDLVNTTSTLTHVVNRDTTSISLTTSSATTTYGTSVTFTATVTNTTTTGLTPTGTVTFSGGNPALSCSTAISGSGSTASTTCITSTLKASASAYTITATYDNTDGNFDDSSGNTDTVSQTVNKAGTSVSVSASPGSPSSYGQAITFTATVTNTSATGQPPTGTINFEDNFTGSYVTISGCGSVSLSGSGNTATAACTTTATGLAVGTHPIRATYTNTDGNFTSATTGSATQLVNKDNTSVSVTTSGSPSAFSGSVTFTGTVTNTSATGQTPTGTLNFQDGGSSISGCSSVSLSGTGNTATATCTTSSLSAGAHTITVIYDNTDGNFSDSATGTLSGGQTVIRLQLSSPGSSNIQVGGGADANSRSSFTVTVTGVATAQTINLSASDGTVLKFSNCSNGVPVTQITTVATSGGATNTANFCAVGVKSGSSTVSVTLSSTSDTVTSSSISVANPTLTLSTCGLTSSSSQPLTLTLSTRQTSDTSITVTSGTTSVGTVVSPQTIIANNLAITFTVTKVANGTTNVTASATIGGSTVTATPAPCNVTFN